VRGSPRQRDARPGHGERPDRPQRPRHAARAQLGHPLAPARRLAEGIALGGRAKDHAANLDVIPPGVGLVGWAALEGRPAWTEDFRGDRRFRTSPAIHERNVALGIVAGLAVPLRLAGRVIGVLSVGSPAPRAFTEAEVELLQGFADHAAVAINNAEQK
jgi:GAF domain-containing protein